MTITWTYASASDVPILAAWNQQLIQDEGHRNPMTLVQLEERMGEWLAGDYRAVIFWDGEEMLGYALYRRLPDYLYLRHLFVRRESRRKGYGRRCFAILRELWPKDVRLTVDVLTRNGPGMAFWRAMGYEDYCLTLEIVPGKGAVT